ncbi:MAG: cytochrome c peroxidase [Nitrospirota bacterium]
MNNKNISAIRTRLILVIILLVCGAFSVNAGSIGPLPALPVFPENPITAEKVKLGKKLFFDKRLSGSGTVNCAACHDPEKGYSDGLEMSYGYPTTKNWRNTLPLINLAYGSLLSWDGRSSTLAEQTLSEIESAFKMNQNIDYLEEELKEVPEYVSEFQRVFGTEITRERIAMALAAFQRTLVSKNAPIDRYLNGEEDALSPIQKKGYDIFTGKGQCVKCHRGPNLAGEWFYNLGVPENPDVTIDSQVSATRRFSAKVSGYKAYRTLTEDPGRYLVTKDQKDWKAFRVPSLRDVALTGPYMHNGVFSTIEEVIDFFNVGGGDDPNRTELLKPLYLDNKEKKALKAFLLEGLKGELVRINAPDLP